MSETYDLILRGGTVVTPGGEMEADIGVRGERIARIGDLSGPVTMSAKQPWDRLRGWKEAQLAIIAQGVSHACSE